MAQAQPPRLELTGRWVQGGFAMGRTEPGAQVILDGETVTEASQAGYFAIGFDRDAPARGLLTIVGQGGRTEHALEIARGDFDVQRINGLAQNQVTPSDPALLARIKEEAQLKARGFASRQPRDDFRSGFIMPLKAQRVSGRFGGQRILNGEPRTPHYGADLAAAKGTPVLAPAAGVVSLAERRMHFEGGLILIDHGQGVVTAYLHLSEVGVSAGQAVSQGQRIGAVGAEGRATGPHLCWRLTWRKRHLDPTLWVGVRAPGMV
jgi:murein DD-endopeptidase MepM/ murein hydrolase activator NlpD